MGPQPSPTSFKLGDFDLEMMGRVRQGGSWKTAPDNRIVVTPSTGAAQTFPVEWKFNSDNQLIVSSGGTELFNFMADKTVTPNFVTRNSVLQVSPSLLDPFTFELRGEWNLTPTHDLEFVPVNGAASTITGVINSPDSKFIFFFNDKKRLSSRKQRLGFVGSWNKSTAGEGKLVFKYRREDGTEDVFELPNSITFNKATNQLRYEYQKGGPQAIDIQGTLVISEDFTITYQISRRLSQAGETMVGETTVSFGAMFTRNNFTGNLELTLTRPDGKPGQTVLTIAGQFVGVLGKTNVAVGFQFDQIRDGQKVTTTFGFAGKIEFSAGTVVFAFKFSNSSGTPTISLAVGADIKLGDRSVDVRLNIDMAGGQVKGVTFLLGTRF